VVAGIDQQPEAACASGAAEWNLTRETSPKKLKKILAMRTERRGGAAILAAKTSFAIGGIVLLCRQ
jgi:hypothetical protein